MICGFVCWGLVLGKRARVAAEQVRQTFAQALAMEAFPAAQPVPDDDDDDDLGMPELLPVQGNAAGPVLPPLNMQGAVPGNPWPANSPTSNEHVLGLASAAWYHD